MAENPAETGQFPVPEGWHTFGTHVDRPDVRLEFSDETGEDGLPWWERPIAPECTCGEAWAGHPNPHSIICPRHVVIRPVSSTPEEGS